MPQATARQSEAEMRRLVLQLQPGDEVEIEHEIKVGMRRWQIVSRGRVVRVERRRHGLHFRRNPDDKVWSDCVVLRRDDGELTTLTVDEFTQVRRRD
jgi:hypothetical protein